MMHISVPPFSMKPERDENQNSDSEKGEAQNPNSLRRDVQYELKPFLPNHSSRWQVPVAPWLSSVQHKSSKWIKKHFTSVDTNLLYCDLTLQGRPSVPTTSSYHFIPAQNSSFYGRNIFVASFFYILFPKLFLSTFTSGLMFATKWSFKYLKSLCLCNWMCTWSPPMPPNLM